MEKIARGTIVEYPRGTGEGKPFIFASRTNQRLIPAVPVGDAFANGGSVGRVERIERPFQTEDAASAERMPEIPADLSKNVLCDVHVGQNKPIGQLSQNGRFVGRKG